MTGRLDPDLQAAQRRERLENLHNQLTEQVEALTTSDGWLTMLKMASKMHGYSFRNIALILAQNESATHVAGYKAWQALGRQVRKGEKGLMILAPLRGKQEVEDQQTGERSTVPVLRGFKIEHVWDVSQTDGPPLPDFSPQQLEGEAPAALWDAVVHSFDEDGYRIVREVPTHPGANGELVPAEHIVRIHPALGPAQALKTALHERSHLSLGHTDDMATYRSHKGIAEAEAERTAFVIAGAWSLDTSAYSVGYVAHWSQGNKDVLTQTAERVVATAHATLERLSPSIGRESAGIGIGIGA
jgi:antirestriction protein ArdC